MRHYFLNKNGISVESCEPEMIPKSPDIEKELTTGQMNNNPDSTLTREAHEKIDNNTYEVGLIGQGEAIKRTPCPHLKEGI